MKRFILIIFILPFYVFAQDYSAFFDNYNHWTFSFYKQIIDKPENQVFSPYFTYNAAAFLYYATTHGTFKQVINTFNYANDKKLQSAYFKRLIQIIKNFNSIQTHFKYAMCLFYEDSLRDKLSETYKQQIKFLLNDTLIPVDFTKSKNQIADDINKYLKNKGFEDIITPDFLDENISLFLISASEFTGQWQNPFTAIVYHPFILDNEGRKTKPILYYTIDDYFEYTESEKFQIIQLPYKDRHFAMQIILPKKNYDIQDFDTIFTYDDYLLWTSTMQRKRIRLLLPAFTIKTTVPLNDKLNKFMFSVFSKGGYFLNMIHKLVHLNQFLIFTKLSVTSEVQNLPPLKIDIYKEADKTGATIMDINHPFFFLIKNKETNSIIFMGHFYRPEIY